MFSYLSPPLLFHSYPCCLSRKFRTGFLFFRSAARKKRLSLFPPFSSISPSKRRRPFFSPFFFFPLDKSGFFFLAEMLTTASFSFLVWREAADRPFFPCQSAAAGNDTMTVRPPFPPPQHETPLGANRHFSLDLQSSFPFAGRHQFSFPPLGCLLWVGLGPSFFLSCRDSEKRLFFFLRVKRVVYPLLFFFEPKCATFPFFFSPSALREAGQTLSPFSSPSIKKVAPLPDFCSPCTPFFGFCFWVFSLMFRVLSIDHWTTLFFPSRIFFQVLEF